MHSAVGAEQLDIGHNGTDFGLLQGEEVEPRFSPERRCFSIVGKVFVERRDTFPQAAEDLRLFGDVARQGA